MNIYTKYEVSMTMYVDRRVNQRKVQKTCHLKTTMSNYV